MFPPLLVFVIVVLEAAGDMLTTSIALGLGIRERNPIVRRFVRKFGNKKGPLAYLPLEISILFLIFSIGYNALLDLSSAFAGSVVVGTSVALAVGTTAYNTVVLVKFKRRQAKVLSQRPAGTPLS